MTISFDLPGTFAETNGPISGGGSESGYIYFTYSDGVYLPGSFVPVPEPATLGLVGTGLGAIWLRSRKPRLKSVE